MCVLQPTRCRNRWRNGSGFSAKTAPPATIYSGEHAVAERRCLLTRNRRFAGDLSKLLLDRANIYEWPASGFPSNCARHIDGAKRFLTCNIGGSVRTSVVVGWEAF